MLKIVENWTVFDAPAQTIVNTVNCVGVMGRGLALEIKRRFPEVYFKYRKMCERGELTVGKLQLVKAQSRWVLNFPTKVHWRTPSRISYIEKGLKKFASTYKRRRITSIAFPPLGCGSGGLRWKDVRPVMERYLKGLLDIDTYVCLGGVESQPLAKRPGRKRPTEGSKKLPTQLELPVDSPHPD